MDDTFADESGIPFLSSADDIPVHSTPIKGTKIPLPSTKNVMKQLMSKPDRYDDFTDSESLLSIRHPDLPPRVKGQYSAQKTQGQNGRLLDEENFVRKSYDCTKAQDVQDLSNIDNLRQKTRNYEERGFQHEGSRSCKQGQRSSSSEDADVFKRPKGVPKVFSQSTKDGGKNLSERQKDCDKTLEQDNNSNKHLPTQNERYTAENRNSNAFSSYQNRAKYLSVEQTVQQSLEVTDTNTESNHEEYQYTRTTKEGTGNTKTDFGSQRQESLEKLRFGLEIRDPSSERKRFSFSRNMSNSKQNTSLSELENTTLLKQRQEIQLLMGELKDRDRELSDMMNSHQQQLVAWQQDRDRLTSLERKCTQHEEELRMKASQLRNAFTNLKTMKTTETENKKDLENFRSSMERLTQENSQYKEEISQLQGLNDTLQQNMNSLSNKVGTLEAREEELVTSLRLKEKDISSATGHMRELSERLQQLDLKCKECQDRERDAFREKQDWQQKYENSKDEFETLAVEMDHRRKEAVRLAEENKSARQQLALIQKEAGMMERCKDELIDSMRVKQDRTDTQLRNLRELYDRQVREVASLQMQLDNSKELIYRQQNSIDEQHSYQGRLSQASEYSMERSSASQRQSGRNKSSFSHSSKYKEPDMTGSHQHTQSSGYHSQLYENQTGNQPMSNTLENNDNNLTGSKQASRLYQVSRSERTSQTSHIENHSVSRHFKSHNILKDSDNMLKNTNPNIETDLDKRDFPETRDAARELINTNYHAIPKDYESSAKLCHTPPKVQTRLVFESPQRQDGFVVQETTVEIVTEEINTGPKKHSDLQNSSGMLKATGSDKHSYCELSANAVKAMERAENMLTRHCETSKDKTDNARREEKSNSESDNGAKNNFEGNLCDRPKAVTKHDEIDNEACCDIEFEKKYTFENKLCSFLEDLDDIDDSIWDEKPVNSANVSETDTSTASKLRKLLIESQEMIQSLEGTESPRQIRQRDSRAKKDQEISVSTGENIPQNSN